MADDIEDPDYDQLIGSKVKQEVEGRAWGEPTQQSTNATSTHGEEIYQELAGEYD